MKDEVTTKLEGYKVGGMPDIPDRANFDSVVDPVFFSHLPLALLQPPQHCSTWNPPCFLTFSTSYHHSSPLRRPQLHTSPLPYFPTRNLSSTSFYLRNYTANLPTSDASCPERQCDTFVSRLPTSNTSKSPARSSTSSSQSLSSIFAEKKPCS
jgi:hypothetical protein